MDITRQERRAYIFKRIQEAAEKLYGRKDFDFSASDPRINRKQAEATTERLELRISEFINGDCRAEEVQTAWIECARAHQIKEPEPLTLFGKESTDEQQRSKQPAKRGGRTRTHRDEIRQFKTEATVDSE
jgi:hypothetical protein